jgi:hypothetical protein
MKNIQKPAIINQHYKVTVGLLNDIAVWGVYNFNFANKERRS